MVYALLFSVFVIASCGLVYELIAGTLAIRLGYTPADAPLMQVVRKVAPAPAPKEEPAAPVAGNVGRLTITTQPSGARVSIDGKAAGETPLTLDTAIDQLSGIGKVTAQSFRRLGVRTVHDILYHFPHRYDDYTSQKQIADLEIGAVETVIATVVDVRTFGMKAGGQALETLANRRARRDLARLLGRAPSFCQRRDGKGFSSVPIAELRPWRWQQDSPSTKNM